MQKSIEFAFAALIALGAAGSAFAQNTLKVEPVAPPAAAQPAPAQQGGIQGQNILDVKPEVKPDANSADAKPADIGPRVQPVEARAPAASPTPAAPENAPAAQPAASPAANAPEPAPKP